MDEELLKINKLESLAILASGISHDLNNILAAIIGNISLAKFYLKPDDPLVSFLAEAEKACSRAKDLSWQFLTFSKGSPLFKQKTSIGELVRETVRFAIRGSAVDAHYFITDSLWDADVDEGQISQVIDNLVINACQAMKDGGSLTITCENIILTPERNYLPIKAGNYVRISIKDTGTGIKPQHLSKIFDPYFTTKSTGHGLGLTISYSIVKNHRGYIDVISQLGVGTTFSVYLPASVETSNSI